MRIYGFTHRDEGGQRTAVNCDQPYELYRIDCSQARLKRIQEHDTETAVHGGFTSTHTFFTNGV